MFRLRKNKSLLHSLQERELGISKCPKRLGFRILRLLIASQESKLEKVWKHQCVKRVCCEGGRLFLHDFTTCYSLWGWNSEPSPLYTFENRPGKKMDCLTCSGRHVSNNPGPLVAHHPPTYRGFFLALSTDNWLRSYDNQSGKVLQEVYLGDKRDLCEFKHLLWESIGDRVYVTCNVVKANPRSGKCPEVAAVIIVFTVFPLEFIAMMKITNVFGTCLQKINVDMGTLIIGKGSSERSVVRIYDFEHILKNDVLFEVKLGEPCDEPSDGLVGTYPMGLPLNCVIRSPPPLLFCVECSDYAVHFGGSPWHYMVLKQRKNMYEVRQVEDNVLLANDVLKYQETDFDTNRAFFHGEYHNRIIHECPTRIQVHKISVDPDHNVTSLVPLFTMGFFSDKPPNLGKRAPNLRNIDSKHYFTAAKSVMCLDYEDELDLIAVFGYDPHDPFCAGKLNVYDNYLGQLVKSFDLNVIVDEVLRYEITFDLDTVVLSHNMVQEKFCCIVYKLCWPDHPVHTMSYSCAYLPAHRPR